MLSMAASQLFAIVNGAAISRARISPSFLYLRIYRLLKLLAALVGDDSAPLPVQVLPVLTEQVPVSVESVVPTLRESDTEVVDTEVVADTSHLTDDATSLAVHA